MRIVYIIALVFISATGMAQDNVARLTTLIGSRIEFNFNTMDDYYNGIRIEDGTTIGITMSGILPAVLTGWVPWNLL